MFPEARHTRLMYRDGREYTRNAVGAQIPDAAQRFNVPGPRASSFVKTFHNGLDRREQGRDDALLLKTNAMLPTFLFKCGQHVFGATLAAVAPTLLRALGAFANGRGHQHLLQGHFHIRCACLGLWSCISKAI